MGPDLVRRVGGRKFLWDGVVYATRGEAEARADAYRADGFEVQQADEGEQHLVYTRRTVKQTATA